MRLRAWLGLVVAAGCSAPSTREPAPLALSLARQAFGADVGRGAALGRHEGGFVGGLELATALPELADGVVRLTHGQLASAWIEQRALGLRPRRGAAHEAALVFGDVADGVDVLMTVERHRFEELRVVTRREGLVPMRWSLRLGPGLASLRLRDGRVEALEADGTARLATAPIVAYDARGRAVRLDLALSQRPPGVGPADSGPWELSLSPDPEAELPVTVDPAWAPTSAMLESRTAPALVDLGEGKVLAIGGSGSPVGNPISTSTAERWDPKTSTWTAIAPMANNRVHSAAVRLADGRVLVAGGAREGITGYPLGRCWQSAEIYDPKINTWKPAATMSVMRGQSGGHLLSNGKVLVFGGSTCAGLLASSELYDPITDSWSPGPTMSTPQVVAGRFAEVGLDKLVVAGERYEAPFGGVDLFDGTKFTAVGALAADGRQGPDAVVRLGGGKALMLNGAVAAPGYYFASTKAELFDAATLKITAAADSDGRWVAAYAPLPGGKAMVIGGQQTAGVAASTSVYDSAANTWTAGSSSLTIPRRELSAIVTSGGQILAVGSALGQKEVDVYDLCATGFLADGACCDKACTGPCERCDLPGKVGVCSPIAAGAPRALRSCGEFLCGASGACVTKCTKDAECVAGRFCDATGACKVRLAKGAACTKTAECASGFCVDGVCCDAACDGQCEACDLTGIAGTCAPVEGGVHGTRAPCDGAAEQCGKRCDGLDRKACVYRGAEVSCGDDGCLGNVSRKKGVCKEGKCLGEARDCSPYRCGLAGCPSGCADSSECTSGFVCVEKVCVAPPKEIRCSDDRRSVLAYDGAVKQTCVDYLCESGACLLACKSSLDCFPGLVCNTGTSACVVPTTTNDASDDGGCALGARRASRASSPLGAGALAMVLMGLIARRRAAGAR